MSTSFSGTYIGTLGTGLNAAGTGLSLTNDTPNYTLTSFAVAEGGAGSFLLTHPSGRPRYSAYETGGAGGIGLYLTAGRSLTNYGHISGGAGGDVDPGTGGFGLGGVGGIGIYLASTDRFINHGSVTGGDGGSSGVAKAASDGAGGSAVQLGADSLIINEGWISGGSGGDSLPAGATPGFGGNGGTGIYSVAYSSLLNRGTIVGGEGGNGGFRGANGGVGVSMLAGGLLGNTAVITGGNGSANTILGGTGGNGINFGAGYLLNSGSVSGGAGGDALPIAGSLGGLSGRGGDGISSGGGVVINTGHITGGNAGSSKVASTVYYEIGGAGVQIFGGVLFNLGVITGGAGAKIGGNGGEGVVITGASSPDINYGKILGGNGNGIGYGGVGVEVGRPGVEFVNYGTITGGNGAVSDAAAPLHASGITLDGNTTLVNFGLIAAGHGSLDAVYFFLGSALLDIDASARFDGTVAAAGTGNVLELSGNKFGTLTGFGTSFVGFQTIQIDNGASWAISGNVANVLDNGLVDIASGTSLDVSSAVSSASEGIFELTGKSSLEIASLLGSNVKIEFLGATAANKLAIDLPSDFGTHAGNGAYAGPMLEDFKAGDSIDLKGIGSIGLMTKYNASTGVLQVTTSGGGVVASLQFQNASLGSGSFHLVSDNAGGSVITLS